MEIPGACAPEAPKPREHYIIISNVEGTPCAVTALAGKGAEFSASPTRVAYIFESFAYAACVAYHAGGRIVRIA